MPTARGPASAQPRVGGEEERAGRAPPTIGSSGEGGRTDGRMRLPWRPLANGRWRAQRGTEEGWGGGKRRGAPCCPVVSSGQAVVGGVAAGRGIRDWGKHTTPPLFAGRAGVFVSVGCLVLFGPRWGAEWGGVPTRCAAAALLYRHSRSWTPPPWCSDEGAHAASCSAVAGERARGLFRRRRDASAPFPPPPPRPAAPYRALRSAVPRAVVGLVHAWTASPPPPPLVPDPGRVARAQRAIDLRCRASAQQRPPPGFFPLLPGATTPPPPSPLFPPVLYLNHSCAPPPAGSRRGPLDVDGHGGR